MSKYHIGDHCDCFEIREQLESRNALLEKENALLRKVREAAEHLMQTGWIRESADALGIALSACERGERTNG